MSLLTDLYFYAALDGNLTDATGGHTLAMHTGSPVFTTGKVGQAAVMNQVSPLSKAIVPNTTLILVGPWTVSMWVKVTSAPHASDAFFVNTASVVGGYIKGGTWQFYKGGFFDTGVSYTSNVWTHVLITHDGATTLSYYIDNALVATDSAAGASATLNIMGFGVSWDLNDQFPGQLDEIGMWTRVLSGPEIADLYNGGAGKTYPFVLPSPVVSSISPVTGPSPGGTAVTITGTDFVSGAGVQFGGVPATSVVYVDPTSITCVTPAHAAGVVDVTVTNPDTQSGTLAGAYVYEATPPVFTDYGTQLTHLLPPGKLWNLEGNSGLQRLLLGMGDEFARVEARAAALLNEADPRTADETIADWERVLSLPDDQVTEIPATLAARRIAVVQKLVGRTGQNLAFYVALAAACGYYIPIGGVRGCWVTKHAVDLTRSGTLLSGDRLSGVAWANAITVSVNAAYATGGLTHAQFEAVIRHATHAHITVVFEYT